MLRRSTAFDALCDKLRHSQFQRPHETHSLSCQLQNRFFVEATKATKNDSMSLKKDFNFRIRIFCSLQLEFRAWQDIALTSPWVEALWVRQQLVHHVHVTISTLWTDFRIAGACEANKIEVKFNQENLLYSITSELKNLTLKASGWILPLWPSVQRERGEHIPQWKHNTIDNLLDNALSFIFV